MKPYHHLPAYAESAGGDVLSEAPAHAAESAPAAMEEDAAQEGQLRACKTRMVELLLPGETVFDALRRLAVRGAPSVDPPPQVCGSSRFP